MIPRILVPRNLRPVTGEDAKRKPRRLSSSLDSRTVVPSDLPVTRIDPKSSIPTHVPLDVLAPRLLVPRDLPAKPMRVVPAIPEHVPLTVLDSRVVVPREVSPAGPEEVASFGHAGPLPPELLGVLEPDLITTGEINLLTRPVEERASNWGWISRTSSVLFHCALIVFALFWPKIFPARTPTKEEMDLARRQLSFVYLPPSVMEVPKVAPQPSPPSPHIRLDPRVLRQIAPPVPGPAPVPGPSELEAARVPPNLPAAPLPRQPVASGPSQPSSRNDNSPHFSRLEDVAPPRSPPSALNLALPRMSPGKALEQSLRGALQGGGRNSGGFADPLPSGPGSGEVGGQGVLSGGVTILTPTEGVDFSNYLARLLASVKQNWYAVIPESARLGEKGRVIIRFRITRDGDVPFPEPILERTSGKEPLDRAAMSSIRASSPFEPLPLAFSGPYIELRFTFLYNLPLDYR